MVQVYVGALYLSARKKSAEEVISDGGPKRVSMHVLIEELTAKESVKAAKTGDVILLDYVPGSGTRVVVNNEAKGTVPGDDFNRALLRIWLGDQPADMSLKKAMLGQ